MHFFDSIPALEMRHQIYPCWILDYLEKDDRHITFLSQMGTWNTRINNCWSLWKIELFSICWSATLINKSCIIYESCCLMLCAKFFEQSQSPYPVVIFWWLTVRVKSTQHLHILNIIFQTEYSFCSLLLFGGLHTILDLINVGYQRVSATL